MTRRSELRIFPDRESLNQAAAEKIAAALGDALREKESAALVLAGGMTPVPVYERLAASRLAQAVEWHRVHFYWGDERCVGPGSPESNFRMAWSTLLSHLPANTRNIHRIPAELPDHDKAAALYESEIRRNYPAGAVPSFDLVLLGMGADGHTASLFPLAHWDEERLVAAVYAPSLQAYRISMTPRLLNAAREIMFLTSGAAKAGALKTVMDSPGAELPAARIRPAKGNITWFVDREATNLLDRT